jgi:hypothetical protein
MNRTHYEYHVLLLFATTTLFAVPVANHMGVGLWMILWLHHT